MKNPSVNTQTPAGTHMTNTGSFRGLRDLADDLPVGDLLITPIGYVYIVDKPGDVRLLASPSDGLGFITREGKFNQRDFEQKLEIASQNMNIRSYRIANRLLYVALALSSVAHLLPLFW